MLKNPVMFVISGILRLFFENWQETQETQLERYLK